MCKYYTVSLSETELLSPAAISDELLKDSCFEQALLTVHSLLLTT